MHHYAAGLIDGEGYIGIQDSGGSFQVRLKIGMTDKGLPALNRMAAQYGGRVYKDREAKGNNRESHCWVTTGTKAAEIIRMVKPHLLVKTDPARIALQFQNMLDAAEKHPNGRTVWTDEMRDKARYFREQIQYANRTGPDPTPVKYPDAKPFAKHRGGAWWEPDDSLFGPEPFEGKFPTAGRMVNGVAYELRTWERRTGDTGYSSSQNDDDDDALLRTPCAAEADGGPLHPDTARDRGQTLRLTGQILAHTGHLLPTPRTTDSNGPGRHGTGGADLRTIIDEHDDPRGWGRFAPAIERWERETGRPAPESTVPTGRGGKHQLNPEFVEWMMGLPEGWVTEVPLSRKEHLKALGNGVVPQQCTAVLRDMLANTEVGQEAA